MRIPAPWLALASCAVLLSGCGQKTPQWREYEEVYIEPQARQAPAMMAQPSVAPSAPVSLKWTTPESWTDLPASSMRLANFSLGSGDATGICTVIKLGGSAGGIEANIKRWMGQVNIEPPPAAELAAFIERQPKFTSAGGMEGVLVDLTPLGDPAPETTTMLAALFPGEDMTLFVKLTGPRKLLAGEKERFEKLCRSLKRGEE